MRQRHCYPIFSIILMIGFLASVPSIAQQAMRTSGLELDGTVVSDNGEMNLAIITDPSTNTQRIYHEGDRVGQKVLVKKIMRHRVIIDDGSGDILLNMLHKGSLSPQGQATAPRLAMGNPGPVLQTPAPTHIDSQNAQTRNLSVSLDRQEVEDALSDHSQLLDEIRLSPTTANNRPDGVEITNIPSGSVLSKTGLGNSDKIMSVNDEEISSPEQVSAFLESLKQGGNFVVKVKVRVNHWVRVRRVQLKII
jgi:type II secretion system protein C